MTSLWGKPCMAKVVRDLDEEWHDADLADAFSVMDRVCRHQIAADEMPKEHRAKLMKECPQMIINAEEKLHAILSEDQKRAFARMVVDCRQWKKVGDDWQVLKRELREQHVLNEVFGQEREQSATTQDMTAQSQSATESLRHSSDRGNYSLDFVRRALANPEFCRGLPASEGHSMPLRESLVNSLHGRTIEYAKGDSGYQNNEWRFWSICREINQCPGLPITTHKLEEEIEPAAKDRNKAALVDDLVRLIDHYMHHAPLGRQTMDTLADVLDASDPVHSEQVIVRPFDVAMVGSEFNADAANQEKRSWKRILQKLTKYGTVSGVGDTKNERRGKPELVNAEEMLDALRDAGIPGFVDFDRDTAMTYLREQAAKLATHEKYRLYPVPEPGTKSAEQVPG